MFAPFRVPCAWLHFSDGYLTAPLNAEPHARGTNTIRLDMQLPLVRQDLYRESPSPSTCYAVAFVRWLLIIRPRNWRCHSLGCWFPHSHSHCRPSAWRLHTRRTNSFPPLSLPFFALYKLRTKTQTNKSPLPMLPLSTDPLPEQNRSLRREAATVATGGLLPGLPRRPEL